MQQQIVGGGGSAQIPTSGQQSPAQPQSQQQANKSLVGAGPVGSSGVSISQPAQRYDYSAMASSVTQPGTGIK